ncbi:MAG: Tol-Pal system beta propeller repeat protein TolB, partial [Nitrospirota bacterium]
REAEKIAITLLPVSGAGVAAPALKEIAEVLSADLRRSGFFDVTVNDGAASSAPPDQSALQRLKAAGAKGALWARAALNGDELVLEGRLFDLAGGRQMLGKRYVGRESYRRFVTHRFADDVVYQFTGERGIAQSRVAYVSDQTKRKELYLMDYDGHQPRRITGDQSLSLAPRWSPDGRWITYLCYRGGNPDICGIDLAENRRWKLVTFAGLNLSPAWSPDGEWMAFASNHQAANLELRLVDRSGAKHQRLTFSPGDDLSPSWSPTGRQLVFTSDRGGTPQLYLMDADGSNVRRLTFQGDYNTSPAWSPRGDWIAYACRRFGRMRLCLIRPDGREGGIFTPDGAWNDEAPTWSPSGRQLIFTSNRTGRYQLYFIQSDGTGLEQLTTGADNRVMPAWSPK